MWNFHFYFLTAMTQNIHFMNVNRYVFKEFACVLEEQYQGPILNYKETYPHLLQQKTIYPDTQHVEIEPRNYLLKTKKEYDFVVDKLKQFKRKWKKIRQEPNSLFESILDQVHHLGQYTDADQLWWQTAFYVIKRPHIFYCKIVDDLMCKNATIGTYW